MNKVFKRAIGGALVVVTGLAAGSIVFERGKEYRDPIQGVIEKQLMRIETPKERAEFMASVLRDVQLPINREGNEFFSYKGVDFEISHEEVINGSYQVSVIAKKGDERLIIDNPLRYIYAGFCLKDGTFYKEELPSGEIIDVENCSEDPEGALKEEIYTTVASQNNL